jgi:hypothetical protein
VIRSPATIPRKAALRIAAWSSFHSDRTVEKTWLAPCVPAVGRALTERERPRDFETSGAPVHVHGSKDYVGPGALVELLWGGMRLDPARYREVAEQTGASRLCAAIAVLAGAATGLGRGPELEIAPVVAAVLYVLVTLTTVAAESALVWLVARVVLRRTTSFGRIARPLALATAPRLVYVVAAAGTGMPVVELAGSLWLLAAFVVGVEAAVRRGWGVAIGTTAVVGILRWLTDLAVRGP